MFNLKNVGVATKRGCCLRCGQPTYPYRSVLLEHLKTKERFTAHPDCAFAELVRDAQGRVRLGAHATFLYLPINPPRSIPQQKARV